MTEQPPPVHAEVSVDPHSPDADRDRLLGAAADAMAACDVTCDVGPATVALSGELGDVLQAVKAAHVLLARHSPQVVTTLRIESRSADRPPRAQQDDTTCGEVVTTLRIESRSADRPPRAQQDDTGSS